MNVASLILVVGFVYVEVRHWVDIVSTDLVFFSGSLVSGSLSLIRLVFLSGLITCFLILFAFVLFVVNRNDFSRLCFAHLCSVLFLRFDAAHLC